MRSSIFNNDPPVRAAPMSRAKNVQRKSKSSSPYINTPHSTPTLASKSSNAVLVASGTSGAKAPNNIKLSWKLDDLIATYQDSGVLPPILSPTLPNEKERSSSLEEKVKLEKKEEKRTIETEHNSPSPLKQKNYDSEPDENIPLSLLSPTLPSIFDSTPKPPPKKPEKPPKVRWINKLNDTNKPRFLLRIAFGSQARRTLAKMDDKKEDLAGLGIITSEEPNKRDERKRLEEEKNKEEGRKREEELKREEARKREERKTIEKKTQVPELEVKKPSEQEQKKRD